MLIWLASYPRSGNTLLRTILKRSFGLQTYSVYNDTADIGASRALSRLVGHVKHRGQLGAFLDEAEAARGPVLVKTHELPAGDHKAIYIVRDGRSSCVSYYHYLKAFTDIDVGLEEIVLGTVFGGLWMKHVTVWALRARPHTLVVRYEDLAAGDEATIDQIGAHIGVAPKATFDVSFEAMHQTSPRFFRKGSDADNIAELNAYCPTLYDTIHGDVARQLGYMSRRKGSLKAARAEVAQLTQRFLS